MADRTHRYRADAIEVTYDTGRCIHAAECVRGLPAVFDTERRPWVQPENASADAIAEVIMRCPSGALHFTRLDGGTAEAPPETVQITPQPDGPLYLHGDIEVRAPDGSTIAHDTRLALCRCGQSASKPFCDNTHKKIDFHAPGTLAEQSLRPPDDGAPAVIVVTPTENGPLRVTGAFEICDAAGETCMAAGKASLCRCGGSGSKPFCDGTHSKNGFQG